MMAEKESQSPSRNVLKVTDKTETWGGGEAEEDQVGWLKPENAYSPHTLIGNWNEKRFDVSLLAQAKPLPSQHNHYFETTYSQSYSRTPPNVPEALKFSRGEREPRAYPSHQPVLDPPQIKQTYNSFLTSSMAAYGQGTQDAKIDNCSSAQEQCIQDNQGF